MALVVGNVGAVVVSAELQHPWSGGARGVEKCEEVDPFTITSASRRAPAATLLCEHGIRQTDLIELVRTFVGDSSRSRPNHFQGCSQLFRCEGAELNAITAVGAARQVRPPAGQSGGVCLLERLLLGCRQHRLECQGLCDYIAGRSWSMGSRRSDSAVYRLTGDVDRIIGGRVGDSKSRQEIAGVPERHNG
jgi:hypothetical protein